MSRQIAPQPPTKQATARAPWMAFALQELGKHVHEVNAPGEIENNLYLSLAANNPHGPTLLDWDKLDHQMAHPSDNLASVLMNTGNPEVKKYLDSVRTDPDLDKKRRSYKLDAVRKDPSGWRMTAWCAAFVNWCLSRADAPHLGYATAASWLKFGLPMAHPDYGCVVVIKPGSATSSTTGHVAFYGSSEGHHIWLLGGNQHQKVSWMKANKEKVRGYRWPGAVGDFPHPNTSVSIA